jgi:hypothetical protein
MLAGLAASHAPLSGVSGNVACAPTQKLPGNSSNWTLEALVGLAIGFPERIVSPIVVPGLASW